MAVPSGIRTALPFAVFYGAIFLAMGVFLPFWPVYLKSRGLDPASIGTIMAAGTWAKTATNPLLGHLADRTARRRIVLGVLGTTAAAGAALIDAASGLAAILAAHLLIFTSFQGAIPLGESQTMAAVTERGLDYGRLRVWGSLAFIAGVLVIGELLAADGPGRIPVAMIPVFLIVTVAAVALPAADRPRDRDGRAPLGRLVRDPVFPAFLLGSACLQASHAAYYSFSAIHWQDAGIAPETVSWLWVEGVVAEVGLFMIGGAAIARLGPRGLLLLAAAGGAVRWSVLAATTAVPLLAAVQWMHALTFGAAHLGAMYFIARHAPAGLQTTAQATYAAVSGGLGMGLMTLAAGGLYEVAPWAAFAATAAASTAGGLVVLLRVPQPHPDWA